MGDWKFIDVILLVWCGSGNLNAANLYSEVDVDFFLIRLNYAKFRSLILERMSWYLKFWNDLKGRIF